MAATNKTISDGIKESIVVFCPCAILSKACQIIRTTGNDANMSSKINGGKQYPKTKLNVSCLV